MERLSTVARYQDGYPYGEENDPAEKAGEKKEIQGEKKEIKRAASRREIGSQVYNVKVGGGRSRKRSGPQLSLSILEFQRVAKIVWAHLRRQDWSGETSTNQQNFVCGIV